ncbi:hypothetical protein [Rhizobium sp. Root483D2]|uniref:hypothetical protein n=1 Tax=Rhizobium sp. Root483D2 TaxID=1736545 RepID=UPI00071515E5|nr:hypothetical protein [Rhizobium sp. Root483D2]KQY20796.1 hypothetical protein ASD32_05135 [Rhizobium sp. Root483D2]
MPLTDQTIPYEILVRFDEEGAPKGAHVQSRRRVILDGEVLKDEILPAAPLQMEGFPTSAIMTTATQAALSQVTALNAQVETLQGDLEAALAAIEAAHQGRDQALEAKSAAEMQATILQTNLDQKTTQLQEAQATVSALQEEATSRLALIAELTEQLATAANPLSAEN